jgi:hypothetical protein
MSMNSPARTAKPHGLHIVLAIVVLLLCPLPMAAQQAVTPEQLSVLEKQLDKVAQQMDQLIKDNIRLMQDNSKLMSANLELMQENQLQRKRLSVLADSILAAQYMAARGSTANTRTSTNDAAAEQKRLEREIAAVLLLGIDVNDDLPLSLQERAEDNDPPPDNIPDLRLYRYLLGRLHQARGLLAVPPDERAAIAAKELEGAVIERERYPGLEEDRMRLVSALLGYCERSNQLARVIQSAAEGRTEAERVVFLDRYQATQYPYLQQQMQRARANAGYRMPATNCQ